MAGPVNGLSGKQSFPAANTFQPTQDGNNNVRQRDAQPRENTVQPKEAAAAQSQNTETGNQQKLSVSSSNQNDSQPSGNEPRGSLVDITV